MFKAIAIATTMAISMSSAFAQNIGINIEGDGNDVDVIVQPRAPQPPVVTPKILVCVDGGTGHRRFVAIPGTSDCFILDSAGGYLFNAFGQALMGTLRYI